MMKINVDGVFFSMKHEIPYMKRNKEGGSIVNMSSIAGLNAVLVNWLACGFFEPYCLGLIGRRSIAVLRLETCSARPDEMCCERICSRWNSNQCYLPWHHQHSHGPAICRTISRVAEANDCLLSGSIEFCENKLSSLDLSLFI